MKTNAFLTLSILFVICGCAQNKEVASQHDALVAKAETEARNKAIAQKVFDGLNQRDLSYAELYSPDCKYYLPSSSPNATTREDDIQASLANWQAFPDMLFRVEEMIAEGDMVAARFTITGTHKGEWFGVPASDKYLQSGGLIILRFTDGKIIEQREDFDLLGTFMQLGMELKPASK